MIQKSEPPAPGVNALSRAFEESLYQDFLRDPASVPEDWRRHFASLPPGAAAASPAADATLRHRADELVRAYRDYGHLAARIDPLERPRPEPPELDPAFHGLREEDLDRIVSVASHCAPGPLTLRELIDCLRTTYARSIGVQFTHMTDGAARLWLQERMESSRNRAAITAAEQRRILTRLTDAVLFEEFLRKRFIGAKTFSLEGSETLLPLIDLAIERAGERQVDEIVIAMAHRGRLNVLANIAGKRLRDIFREMEDVESPLPAADGDVKYHLGYSTDWRAASGRTVHVSLCFNPSHLEFVDPVALGRVRAKQDRCGDSERRSVMALLIHGDAAFPGEGIVQESLNLSRLPAYATGGTLHVILNNQIGFTTCPSAARSSRYAGDIARFLEVPIFHVNGEDPEAVAHVVRLAFDFRQAFRRDVIIDMYAYRRRGHNETDDPTFTQPVMYETIRRRPSIRESYLGHLLEHGGLTRQEADEIAERRLRHMEEELSLARQDEYAPATAAFSGVWQGYRGGPESGADHPDTAVPRERLSGLLHALAQVPEDFHPHPKILRGLELRRRMAQGEEPLDWAAAEALAFAALAVDGVPVRLTGQDTARGTFNHRHAALYDHEDGHVYWPLHHLAAGQARIEIADSPLSEAGVLGFEYGYSLDAPDALVLWEAQFGDFVNAAQVVIDQFLVSAERKWHRLSGLVLLLPHGLEGQGPEHSSARIERFLELACLDNIQIAQPTTPAQYFHLLRRQALRKWRKPLVVFTPKSLLRHPRSTSPLEELAGGRFQPVLADAAQPGAPPSRVLLCSGKIYFDLARRREELRRPDVSLLRLEEIYPFPQAALQSALEGCPDGTPVVWIQDEPANMGARNHLRLTLGERLFDRFPLSTISRAASPTPASGSGALHRRQQEALLQQAFSGGPP